ncbi:unnamed protein product [Arctogadus glacialis]
MDEKLQLFWDPSLHHPITQTLYQRPGETDLYTAKDWAVKLRAILVRRLPFGTAHPSTSTTPSTSATASTRTSATAHPSTSATASTRTSATAHPSTSATAHPSTSATAHPSTSATASTRTSATAHPSTSATASTRTSATAHPSTSATAHPSTSATASTSTRFPSSPFSAPVPYAFKELPQDLSSTSIKPHQVFTTDQTLYLIDLMRGHLTDGQAELPQTLAELTDRVKQTRGQRKAFWQDISQKLSEHFSLTFDHEKVSRKWATLIDASKRVIDNNSSTGQGTMKFQFIANLMSFLIRTMMWTSR